MIDIADLPALNASLNGLATVFLAAGFVFVKRRAIAAHRLSMLAAFITSALFLTSYLIYHYHAGSRPFTGQGTWRVIYFTVLLTHVPLAAAILPMALVTLSHALRTRFDKHRRIARWTLPVWLYVSVTGVIVYVMLYQM